MAIRVRSFGETNVGRKRGHNEDNLLVYPEQRLFAVADGMGGHACGEVASQMAVDTLRDFFVASAADPDATWPFREEKGRSVSENRMVAGVKYANLLIFERQASDPRFKQMGTTFVGSCFDDEHIYIAHVGDSRCYRLRDGKLEQMTEDHSLLNDYKKMNVLTPEEEKNFPHKNIIVRALGLKEAVVVDISHHRPKIGDTYLMCSDGLSGEVEDPDIERIMAKNGADLENCAHELIQAACDHGGKDNVTCVLARVEAL